ITLYLWACVHVYGGAIVWPGRELLGALPRPNATALGVIAAFIALQCLLDVVLPGRVYTGAPQKDGRRRGYRLNGFSSLLMTLAGLALLLRTGIIHGASAVTLLGPMLATSILLAYGFAAFLYLYGRREPSYEAPHLGGFSRLVYDYFM